MRSQPVDQVVDGDLHLNIGIDQIEEFTLFLLAENITVLCAEVAHDAEAHVSGQAPNPKLTRM
jgi:hypothetical protein